MLARLVFFNRHALAVGQHGFVATKIDDDITALKTAHGAAHDVTGAVFEFLVDERLLGAANVLLEVLAGVLRGNAAEPGGRYFLFNLIADIRFINDLQRVKSRNLILRIVYPIDHQQFGEGTNLAGLWVRLHAELAAGANCLLCGSLERLANSLVQGLAADALLLLVIIQKCL